MSKRLQVLLDERDLSRYRRVARRRGVPLSVWVRESLRRAGEQEAGADPDRKLASVRAAVRHEFPAPPIEELLAEIERGYEGGGGS